MARAISKNQVSDPGPSWPSCYYIKCFDDEVYEPKLVSYTGEDSAQKFVEMLEEDIRKITSIPKKMIFGKKEKERFNKETKYWICKGEFDDDVKVRDHCHFTGRYRGAAHNLCNLKYRKPNFTPVVFHNLSGYDSHLFIKNLAISEGNIDCIPNNEERYISFTKKIQVGNYTKKVKNNQGETEEKITHLHHQKRFIDSFKFMSTSLDKLVNKLSKDAFKNVKRYYVENKHNLLTKKGIYPYEYMNSQEKKLNYRQKKNFILVSMTKVLVVRITHTGEKFGKRLRLKDYNKLYNKVDVLLLSDIFEKFRNICYNKYNLDPAHYYTAPGLARDAALKKTEVELELLSDPDMLLMFENGIRGGVSTVVTRYGKSNNKYMGDSYDPSKPTKYITYLDANNLYGWAVSKPLPTHGFKWMELNELENWKNDSCVLEVDLEYSRSLHDLHHDYPLVPEQIKINNIEKLIPNLGDKEKYVLH